MTNTSRLIAYRQRSAPVYAADPEGWEWRAAKGARYKDWLRTVAFRCAWLRPRSKVIQLDAVRARRRK